MVRKERQTIRCLGVETARRLLVALHPRILTASQPYSLTAFLLLFALLPATLLALTHARTSELSLSPTPALTHSRTPALPLFSPPSFATYQPILDRMPFGELPPNFGAAADPAQAKTELQVQAEQQKLAKQINMSCVNITPDGQTAIGFTDLSSKPPKNYYLLVGAESDGWKVLSADYDAEWAQITKDDITITLQLGKGLIDAPPATSVASTRSLITRPTNTSDATPPTPRLGVIRRPSEGGGPPIPRGPSALQRAELVQRSEDIKKLREQGGDVKSYMERLKERKAQEKEAKAAAEEEARKQLEEAAQKLSDAELKKKERDLNLSLIEQGAQPVSNIELTPEEESALVEKGVLAP